MGLGPASRSLCGALSAGPREDAAVWAARRLGQRCRRFEKTAPQACHLFHELCPKAFCVSRSCELPYVIGDGTNDGRLPPKTGEPMLRSKYPVVVRFWSSERGHHHDIQQLLVHTAIRRKNP